MNALPRPLQRGDAVAIVSPASAIDPLLIEGAANAIARLGYRPLIMPHASGRHGTYSASDDGRLADMCAALANPQVKAILCSRGGYGAVHLLDRIEPKPVWLIGFSDISALHALWHSAGICSIHGSMARHMALFPADDAPNMALQQILSTGRQPDISFSSHPLNRIGKSGGEMIGGNLAVLGGLVGTPLTLMRPDSILVIEDIAEPIYKVERQLYQLRLTGVLPRLRGLIVGQFTDYKSDPNYADMESMIAEMVASYDYPVAFDAPIGHVDGNMPFIEGCHIDLTVDQCGVTIHQSQRL